MSSEKNKLWWEIQKNGNWKTLTNFLSESRVVHTRFDNFIKTFYWRFRERKSYPRGFYNPEIDFQGFKEFLINEKGLLGYCTIEGGEVITQQTIVDGEVVKEEKKYSPHKMSISINQFYLLSGLGMDKLITDYSTEKISYRDSSLDELIGTVAHELAHAHQNTVNLRKNNEKKSQCESTGDRDSNGNLLYPQLAAEHTRFTTEIQQMIINSSEYQALKAWWTSKKEEPYQDEEKNYEEEIPDERKKCKNCGKVGFRNFCKECIQAEEGLRNAFFIIQSSKSLADLEKNYQIAKNGFLYNSERNNYENKKRIDNFYISTKNYLDNQNSQLNNYGKGSEVIIITLFLAAIMMIILMGLILFSRKRKKHH